MENLLAVSLMTLEDCVSNPIGSRIKIRNDARNHIASTKVDRLLHSLVCWINLLKAFRADKDEVLERLNAMRLDLERHALIKCVVDTTEVWTHRISFAARKHQR